MCVIFARPLPHKIRILHFVCVLVLIPFIQSCSTLKSYNPLPAHLENQVEMPGFHDIRTWGDVPSQSLKKNALLAIKQEKSSNHGQLESEVNALALSGGGEDGAFGAGILCGWSKTGTRPTFRLVTGISTGALMAPFAFLGSAYDPQLKKAYTTMSDKDIYKPYSIFSILLSLANIHPLSSLADNKPLINLVSKLIDESVLKKIAAEHLKGRRLLIGTTQINAQRLVIWNMGAIAASGSPQALDLFRKIMVASASLPASFPPQFFTVEAAGAKFNEMHVDGGIAAQVMLFENALTLFSREGNMLNGHKRIRKLYIIRNQKVYPEWQDVKPQMKYIAVRAIDSLTKSQGIGDLFRLYTYSQRDGIEYHLAYIPKDFNEKSKSEFDTIYMNKLFARGFDMGRAGYVWQKYPPEYTP